MLSLLGDKLYYSGVLAADNSTLAARTGRGIFVKDRTYLAESAHVSENELKGNRTGDHGRLTRLSVRNIS